MLYTKEWVTKFWFNKEGMPKTTIETEEYVLDNFTEHFIHYLSDHLPTITMNPDGDGLDRLHEFKELYVECMLNAKHEYVENSYQCP